MKAIITLLLSYFIFTSVAFSWNTPDLGDPSIKALSATSERKYGDAFMLTLVQQNALYNDLIVQQYIQDLGLKLVGHAENPQRHFHFFVVNDATVNAFAGPNGNIGINTGLIRYVKNQDELASVMAHEIAHVTQKHLARSIESAKRMEIPSVAAIIAAALTGNAAIANGVISSTIAANMQSYINHTREQEKEADRIGIQTLKRSGYNPNGMASLFARMEKENGSDGNIDLTFLQTHPSYLTRVADAKNRSTEFNNTSKHDALTFYLVQSRIETASMRNPSIAAEHYKALLVRNYSPILQYAYALSLANTHDVQTSRAQMHELINAYPNNLIFKLTLGEINLESGHYKESIAALKTSTIIYPNNYPLTLLYAKLLNKDGQYKEAVHYLSTHYATLKADPLFLFIFADSLGKSGNLLEAYETRGHAFITLGQTKEAITQLELALKQETPSAYMQTSLEAQLDAQKKILIELQKNKH